MNFCVVHEGSGLGGEEAKRVRTSLVNLHTNVPTAKKRLYLSILMSAHLWRHFRLETAATRPALAVLC